MQKFPAFILNLKSIQKKCCIISSGYSINLKKSFNSFVSTKTGAKNCSSSWNSIIYNHIRKEQLNDARRVFDKIPSPDVYLYTMMITGYSRTNRIDESFQLFDKMPHRDIVSWNSMIKGCLDCGDLTLGRKVFDEMPERNVISWTTILNGYAQFGKIEIAEELFCKMPWKDTAAWNSMISVYCNNGRIEDAHKVFQKMPSPNVISWTTLIGGLDQHGESEKALSLFRQMLVLGVRPTSTTFACIVTACANIPALDPGVQLHAHLVKSGNIFDTFISSSIITFYANCKQIENSCKVFQESLETDVVVSTALLTGFGLNGKHEDALEVLNSMIKDGIRPNQSTFTSALNSCCGLEALDKGKEIHTITMKLGLDRDVFVGNSLVFMYSKCGNVDDGVIMFNNMSKRNLVSWNSIIVGCAQHGHALRALEFFDQMAHSTVKPDEVTFIGLLTACSHSRMLDKGRNFFELLKQDPSIEVKLEHYACMVDILGRSGNLEEAEDFIKKMPMKANSMVWLALLSACRVHSNLEVAKRTAECIFNLEPYNSAAYVLLSNMYASAGRWHDVSHIRGMMKERGIVKMAGCSWITIKGSRHDFLSGDRSHPMSKEIYKKLDMLAGRLKELGYVSDKRFALHDVEEEQKETMLACHSERLAIGFGLLSTVEGSTIRVIKNLRICGDCHSTIKLISKIVAREIIVRDSSRFHHFRDGTCSCGDYW